MERANLCTHEWIFEEKLVPVAVVGTRMTFVRVRNVTTYSTTSRSYLLVQKFCIFCVVLYDSGTLVSSRKRTGCISIDCFRFWNEIERKKVPPKSQAIESIKPRHLYKIGRKSETRPKTHHH